MLNLPCFLTSQTTMKTVMKSCREVWISYGGVALVNTL